MKKVIVLALLILFPLFARADITFGLEGPFSAQQAVFGEQLRHGTEQAAEDINGAGGILGQKLNLVFADDACDPKQAVTAANELVSKGIKFDVGPFCSASAIPASKVYLDEKAIMITPAATNPKLTDEGGPSIFRVCGRDDQQGGVIADFLLKNYKGKKIAILHDRSAWGKGIADIAKAKLNAAGVHETVYESYTPGEKDYSALVTLLKEKTIDVVFIGGYHIDVGLIVRQLGAAGAKIQVIGGDALASNEFWSIAGPAAEGVLMTFGPDPRKNPAAAEVVRKLEAKHYDSSGYTLYSYAAVQVLAQAIKSAGAANAVKVAQEMHKGKFKTVLGDLSFDAKGDVKAPTYVIYVWHNGQYSER